MRVQLASVEASNFSDNGVECSYYGKRGDIKSECFERKRDKSKGDGSERGEKEKVLVMVTKMISN